MTKEYELMGVASNNRGIVKFGLRPTLEVVCNSAKKLFDRGEIERAFVREVVGVTDFVEIELAPREEQPARPYLYRTFGD